MKRFCLLVGLLGALGTAAMANPVLCASGATLDTYISGNSTFANACQIGDKLFWGFAISQPTGSYGPAASGIAVTTSPGDGVTNVGIVFNSASWVADPGFPIDQTITYNVATLSGASIIEDATLTITGTLTTAGDTGKVIETLTPGVAGSPITATLPFPVSQHINFLDNMQSTFQVKDEIIVSTANTAAHISIVENDFSEAVPEPAVAILLGSGLVLIGLVRRRSVKAEEAR